ncbi:glycosyltransferase [uncultured Draconibacterium sp.]|uniref:glycosyltransferase n=1 Tax=uncultured Draconibacterium sp. TaxID=1573823 RepID=UPI002AA825D5|nr:glycosyltransferase [uncultured Draconibacterium sp.]
MIKNRDIVCIANTTWFGEYTKSTVQLMSRLAKNNRVLFVEYPFTWKDTLTTFLGKQKAPVSRMLGLKSRLELINTENGSKVYNLVPPPVLPVDFIKKDQLFKPFFNLNVALYKIALRKVMKKMEVKDPIVITAYNPFYGLPLIGQLNEALNVYYCYDGIGTRRHGKRIYAIDEAFSKNVDAIVTTSDYINDDKKKFNPKSYVVKNGVDFDTFYADAKNKVHKNEQKIVGYIGSLDHRFDINTVEFAVKNMPDTLYHFTGNLRNQEIKQRLDKFDNVEFFGSVKPNDVPALLATYDVGIIPYLVNDINKNIYPLKINEYMAVGVPVVMTPFADLKDFSGMVSVAENNETFVKTLITELEKDSRSAINKRIEFAKSNSWDIKAEEFGEILNKLLENGND